MSLVITDMINRCTGQLLCRLSVLIRSEHFLVFKVHLTHTYSKQRNSSVSNVNMLALTVLRLTTNRRQLLDSGKHHIFSCVFCCPQSGGHDPATTN